MNCYVNNLGLQKIPGFETTDYGYSSGHIVWAGKHATTKHPRNFFEPWMPSEQTFCSENLCNGADLYLQHLTTTLEAMDGEGHLKGLLRWLVGEELPFPLSLSSKRFDDIKRALLANDLTRFNTAALRVLGLGQGLTPSGDDFVGGIFFALHYAPRQSWIQNLPDVKSAIHHAAQNATNVISASLLDDLMAGKSYSTLHDVLNALDTKKLNQIIAACEKLLTIGASSGADMLAGLLVALTTRNKILQH